MTGRIIIRLELCPDITTQLRLTAFRSVEVFSHRKIFMGTVLRMLRLILFLQRLLAAAVPIASAWDSCVNWSELEETQICIFCNFESLFLYITYRWSSISKRWSFPGTYDLVSDVLDSVDFHAAGDNNNNLNTGQNNLVQIWLSII